MLRPTMTAICLVFATIANAAEPQQHPERADAKKLLARLKQVLPAGWEARLHWNSAESKFKAQPIRVDWMEMSWKQWLPGMDGRHIEVRRKIAVEFFENVPGPDELRTYARKEVVIPRFALTLSEIRIADDIDNRLAKLNKSIKRLETILKPSFNERMKDGYIRHSIPPDDKGLRALQKYDQLWAIKRWFPQWSEGTLSVGYRSLTWPRILPDDAKKEFFDVKNKVLATLKANPGRKFIPANDE